MNHVRYGTLKSRLNMSNAFQPAVPRASSETVLSTFIMGLSFIISSSKSSHLTVITSMENHVQCHFHLWQAIGRDDVHHAESCRTYRLHSTFYLLQVVQNIQYGPTSEPALLFFQTTICRFLLRLLVLSMLHPNGQGDDLELSSELVDCTVLNLGGTGAFSTRRDEPPDTARSRSFIFPTSLQT